MRETENYRYGASGSGVATPTLDSIEIERKRGN